MARFLVVDNDHANALATELVLRADGHEVSRYTSGAEAVEALKSEAFDVVVTDLQMPHTNGFAVVQAARGHSPDSCVVVASGKALEHHDALAKAGPCIVSDKPVDMEAITRVVVACRERGGPAADGCELRKSAPLFQLKVKP